MAEGRSCSSFWKVMLFGFVFLCSSTATKFASEGSVEEMVKPSLQPSENDELENSRTDHIHKFVDGKVINAKDYFEDMYLKAEVDDPWANLEVVSVSEYFSASDLYSLDEERDLSSILPQAQKLETYMANPAHTFEHLEPSIAEYVSERLGYTLLRPLALKLPAIPDNGVEIPNEDPVSFTESQAQDLASPAGAANLFGLSSKGVMALLITILVIAFKHYKKVCRGSRNVAPMQRREETHVKASPSLTGMNIPRQEDVFNAMRHWERKRMQSYLSPWGIRSLPTPLLNNAESHLSTRKVQQISEYRGFLFEQLADYRGFRRSTIVLKLKQKNKDLWETRLKSGR